MKNYNIKPLVFKGSVVHTAEVKFRDKHLFLFQVFKKAKTEVWMWEVHEVNSPPISGIANTLEECIDQCNTYWAEQLEEFLEWELPICPSGWVCDGMTGSPLMTIEEWQRGEHPRAEFGPTK